MSARGSSTRGGARRSRRSSARSRQRLPGLPTAAPIAPAPCVSGGIVGPVRCESPDRDALLLVHGPSAPRGVRRPASTTSSGYAIRVVGRPRHARIRAVQDECRHALRVRRGEKDRTRLRLPSCRTPRPAASRQSSITARRSSIRSSSVATSTRSDRPVPRLSNMIRRQNDARRSKYLRSAGSSHCSSRFETNGGT